MSTLFDAAESLREADVVELQRKQAKRCAYKRAIGFGYVRLFANALAKTAEQEWFSGEDPEHTAARIVKRPNEYVGGRPT